MTLSNKDIFYIKGVHEIIIDYKNQMDVLLKEVARKEQLRLEERNWIASVKHIRRLRKSRIFF